MTCSPHFAKMLLLLAASGCRLVTEAQLFQNQYQGEGFYPGYQERDPPYEVLPPPPAVPNNTVGFGVAYSGMESRAPVLSRQELPLLLDAVDAESSEQCSRHVGAQWRHETDVNPGTQAAAMKSQDEYARFQRALWQIVRQVRPEQAQGNPRLARMLRLLSVAGPSALPPEQLHRYNRIIREMLAVYETASICAYKDAFLCNLFLDPDLTLIMARSRDWDELQYYWKEYHDKTGMKVRDQFEQLVDVSNEAARVNNFTDTAEYWMFPYESPTFRTDVDYVWSQIQPLYAQLHAYIRRKLRDLYGPDKISRRAPLPSHILGNMWAQSWTNILDVTIPYPGKNFLNVGPELLAQGYTPPTMFRLADDFYRSLNLSAMPPEFWERSVLEQPLDQSVICQPSAWDFCNRRDYRIKMCTQVTMTDLVTAHHEMGHIQYFLQYRDQPKVFRDAANPGMHEAVGDMIALSVSTPQHLQTLGLLRNSVDDLPHNINFLFAQALDKLAFLPYALVLDLWRWDVFEGRTPKTRYNCDYWRLRENYSGVKPPVLRSEIDFDPGSKYHVVANIPYIKFFVGTVLQYQLHRAACRAGGRFDPDNPSRTPLHKCDVYRSPQAGEVLRRLMRPGSSAPWQEALRLATNESQLDGSAIRDYFRPLEDWLTAENQRTGEFIGWLYDGDYCKQSIETANLQVSGGYYNAASLCSSFLGTLLRSVSFVVFLFLI